MKRDRGGGTLFLQNGLLLSGEGGTYIVKTVGEKEKNTHTTNQNKKKNPNTTKKPKSKKKIYYLVPGWKSLRL